ncbi:unnamed protein product [marine sediment metagenome]|uniref:Uncharacterized protein n=1 Tax=marine sediment metagenome TaxID=412755 RepID=X1V6I6_9ZZZZ
MEISARNCEKPMSSVFSRLVWAQIFANVIIVRTKATNVQAIVDDCKKLSISEDFINLLNAEIISNTNDVKTQV